jgi:hypothetical protein
VIFYSKHGLPLVNFDFEKPPFVIEEVLLGGFISAITSLSNELFKITTKIFVVDNGLYKLTILIEENLVLVIISDMPLLHLENGLKKVIQFFCKFFDAETNRAYDPKELDQVRVKLIRVLFDHPITEDWKVIVDRRPIKFQDLVQKYPRIAELQPDKKLSEYPFFNKAFADDLFEILNYAFYEKIVKFDNIFNLQDYITPMENLKNILDLKNPYNVIFCERFPSLEVSTIVPTMMGIVKVNDIMQQFGAKMLDVMHFFYNIRMIDIVDVNHRQIYLLIEILSKLLSDTYDQGNINKIGPIMRNYLYEKLPSEIFAYFSAEPNGALRMHKDLKLLEIKKPEILDQLKQGLLNCIGLIITFLPKNLPRQAKKIVNNTLDGIVSHKNDAQLVSGLKFTADRLLI